jgi:hypothetical protein
MDGQRLALSSSELMTHASIRRKDIALRYSTRPASSAPRASPTGRLAE